MFNITTNTKILTVIINFKQSRSCFIGNIFSINSLISAMMGPTHSLPVIVLSLKVEVDAAVDFTLEHKVERE